MSELTPAIKRDLKMQFLVAQNERELQRELLGSSTKRKGLASMVLGTIKRLDLQLAACEKSFEHESTLHSLTLDTRAAMVAEVEALAKAAEPTPAESKKA